MPQNHAKKEDDFLKMADDSILLRRRTLYPAEVQRHLAIFGYFYSTHLPPFCERREVEQTLRRRTLYPAELRAHIMKFR